MRKLRESAALIMLMVIDVYSQILDSNVNVENQGTSWAFWLFWAVLMALFIYFTIWAFRRGPKKKQGT